jgi:hypothetical protein
MPIHINLLAEAQAAEEMRRHDPVKRAMFLGGVLVVVFLGWAGTVAIFGMEARATLTGVKTHIDTRTNEFQHVMLEQQKLIQAKSKLMALQKLQAARFLQGNLLNALQQATVEGVQLTRLRVEQTYAELGEKGGKTNNEHIKESIILHLSAKDSSANPGDQVNKFQNAIARQPYFQAMLSKTNGVQLAGPPSAVQTDSGKPYVTFMLDCRFADQVR